MGTTVAIVELGSDRPRSLKPWSCAADDVTGLGRNRISVKDLVPEAGVGFKDRGVHKLKGVPDRWRLYSVNF